MKFWGRATTLESFLKAYKANEMKGYFPNEWFEKLQKGFEFFCQDAKTRGIFFTCVQFSYCFFEYVCKTYSSFLTYVRVRSTKLYSNCFSMIYPESLIYSHN